MKTELKLLIENAQPSPLSVIAHGCVWIHAQRDPLKPERIPQMEICRMSNGESGLALTTAMLMTHAYNTLPKLVEALEEANEALGATEAFLDTREEQYWADGRIRPALASIRAVLAEANNPEVK